LKNELQEVRYVNEFCTVFVSRYLSVCSWFGGDTGLKPFTKYMEKISKLYRCQGCGDEFESYQEVRVHCREGCSQKTDKRQKTLNF
jgi:hypothetical protein